MTLLEWGETGTECVSNGGVKGVKYSIDAKS